MHMEALNECIYGTVVESGNLLATLYRGPYVLSIVDANVTVYA